MYLCSTFLAWLVAPVTVDSLKYHQFVLVASVLCTLMRITHHVLRNLFHTGQCKTNQNAGFLLALGSRIKFELYTKPECKAFTLVNLKLKGI